MRSAPLDRAVFLYGTLMAGARGYRELGLEGRLALIGRDRIAGTLYDLGDHPGAVPGGAKAIMGELLMPRDDRVLALLDDYELYDPADPEGSEYVRVQVTTLDGGIEAWTYAYNRDVSEAPVIASGRWSAR